MTKFVIRSMSTTDYVVGSSKPVVPYHIYLQRPEKRGRAWWSQSMIDAQKFDTQAEAIDVRDALFPNGNEQVVPVDADVRGFPNFWDKNVLQFEGHFVEVRHEVLAMHFGTSLPENCFQDFFQLIVDGEESCGAANLEGLLVISNLPELPKPSLPIFMGFSER